MIEMEYVTLVFLILSTPIAIISLFGFVEMIFLLLVWDGTRPSYLLPDLILTLLSPTHHQIMVHSVVFLLLLMSLMELVYCQTFPYVRFMGQTLANNSYVDISQVGNNFVGGTDTVQCHTDLGTCCSGVQGIHRGDWYFPNGTRLTVPGGSSPLGNIYESRTAQRVDIRRTSNANEPTGIYRCDIPTNAVHHATDISVRVSVYVGLYPSDAGKVL